MVGCHVSKLHVFVLLPSGGEHGGPGPREAAAGAERKQLPAGGEGQERAEEEKAAL